MDNNKRFTDSTLSLQAAVIVAKVNEPGISRRDLLIRSRDRLMAEVGISYARAEALVWQAVAEAESREVPAKFFINVEESTRDLLVINTPDKKLVITLQELVQQHLSSRGNYRYRKAPRLKTETLH